MHRPTRRTPRRARLSRGLSLRRPVRVISCADAMAPLPCLPSLLLRRLRARLAVLSVLLLLRRWLLCLLRLLLLHALL